jgi:hypothetical protein
VPKYQQHIEWLKPIDPLKRATNGFESLLKFILTNNLDRDIEIREFEYKTFKGSDWPSWDEFQLDKTTKYPSINEEIKEFVKSKKQVNEFNEFKKQIELLDSARNENFWNTFPELATLK